MNQLKNRNAVYDKARTLWGEKVQLVVAIEELCELNVEITKLVNNKRNIEDPSDKFKVVDELVDGMIMIEQIIHNFNLLDDFKIRRNDKLYKLQSFIDKQLEKKSIETNE